MFSFVYHLQPIGNKNFLILNLLLLVCVSAINLSLCSNQYNWDVYLEISQSCMGQTPFTLKVHLLAELVVKKKFQRVYLCLSFGLFKYKFAQQLPLVIQSNCAFEIVLLLLVCISLFVAVSTVDDLEGNNHVGVISAIDGKWNLYKVIYYAQKMSYYPELEQYTNFRRANIEAWHEVCTFP